MKKYLMTGIAAIAMCAAFTSCSKDPGFEQTTPEQIAQAQYDAAFIKAFGQPAANQDWGFGSRSITRAAGEPEVVKKDVWQNFPEKLDGNAVPADVTEKEAEYVYNWFKNNPNLTEEGKPWKNFFLQQVYGTMDQQKKGLWNKYDQNWMTNNPGATSNWVGDVEFTDKGGMDYLIVGDGTTMTHVKDFNAEMGGPWGIVYMKNSSAMKFGYHGSWDNSDRQLFKLAEIEVPGNCFADGVARKGWYVGLSLLGEKEENSNGGIKNKRLGEQRVNWGDDWILKVVPGEGEETHNYRVIAEDLNASEKTDFDFNDVVFDVIPNGTSSADIKLIAAGGIYKLTVNGIEVHEAFGETAVNGTYPMINTGAGPTYEPVVLCTIGGDFSEANIRTTIKNIVIKVYKPGFEESGVELTATTGKPACKILVDDTFGVVTERQDISNEYGNFTSWVQGYFADDFWWKSGTAE